MSDSGYNSTPETRTGWGLLGTGKICRKFADDLRLLPEARMVGVGSRSQDKANAFAAQVGVERAYSSYEQLASDPEVEIVYIGTPHAVHVENALLCLEAGKAVLVEKPVALNAAGARRIIDEARRRNLLLMEAMWMRFFPLFGTLRALLAEGRIGEPRMITADFGYRLAFDPAHRMYDPDLGGGALLDVGIYPITLATALFGRPSEIQSMAHMAPTGVDTQAAVMLRFPEERMALLHTASVYETPVEAVIMGTAGQIRLHSRMHRMTRFTLITPEGEETFASAAPGHGYSYEAAEAMRCLRAGLIESEHVPHEDTILVMEIMDACRRSWGFRYPQEVD